MAAVKEIRVVVTSVEVARWVRGSEAWMLGTKLREAGVPIHAGSVTHGNLEIVTHEDTGDVVYIWSSHSSAS